MIDQTIYIFIIAILIWLSVISFYLYKTVAHYNRLAGISRKESLSEALDKILYELGKNHQKTADLEDKLAQLSEKSLKHIQKLGIIRYNPFADTGGEQSFILALLDADDTGVILTSLHSRDNTRWYVRAVKEGKGVDIDLSDEEKKAITQASLVSPISIEKKVKNIKGFVKASD